MAIDHAALEGRDHRSYVGPARHYDVLGASQFRLLCSLGLRAHHSVLDFGCGSLRAGRLLIPYLDAGGYCGVEPNEWLVEAGIEKELGRDLVALKQPRFDANEDFRADVFDQRFDFILAQSIFSHTGPDLLERGLSQFATALAPDGLIAATFLNGVDHSEPGWIYPKCATYSPDTIQRLATDQGLHAVALPWFHPRQTWWLMARSPSRLPDAAQRSLLVGVVLGVDDFRASWSGREALRKGLSRWYKYQVLARVRQWLKGPRSGV